jgi:hypothetical protein
MSKAIYSLKMELLLEGNEGVMQLTSRELQGIQRFNRFVVGIYIESWFTCRSAVDAPVNDIRLIQKLMAFDDVPVELWPETQSFVEASAAANHLACVNDCAERGVALIQDFNARAKDEVQKQYLLQVIEQHRRNFKGCSLNELKQM